MERTYSKPMDMRWFQPNSHFLEWLTQQYSQRLVIDMGAGSGYFGYQLTQQGIQNLSYDWSPGRYNLWGPVLHSDGTTHDYPKGPCIVTICRPCHSDWIVDTIHKALADGVEAVLYIGLPHNYPQDTEGLALGIKRKRVFINAGVDNENVWAFGE